MDENLVQEMAEVAVAKAEKNLMEDVRASPPVSFSSEDPSDMGLCVCLGWRGGISDTTLSLSIVFLRPLPSPPLMLSKSTIQFYYYNCSYCYYYNHDYRERLTQTH